MLKSPIPEFWQTQIIEAREIPGHGVCGIEQFIFTCGLLTGLTFEDETYDYVRRYCYPSFGDARAALHEWDGQGDPPGPWIKEKVSGRMFKDRDVCR